MTAVLILLMIFAAGYLAGFLTRAYISQRRRDRYRRYTLHRTESSSRELDASPPDRGAFEAAPASSN